MNTIIGIFSDKDDADAAASDLQKNGIPSNNISVIMKKDEEKDTVQEGAATSATTGGILGGVAGLLVSIGAIVLPGIGGVLVGGPLVTALGLTGAAATAAATVAGGVTGALAGGLVGGLIGLGISEEEARIYESKIKEGGILLAAALDDEDENDIREIFLTHHATDVKTLKAQVPSSESLSL